MAVHLATLKAAVAQADAQAQLLQAEGRADAATAVYETLLGVLHLFLSADAEPPSGWLRTALLLTDLRRRLALDAIESVPARQLHLRANAISDLPEVATIHSAAELSAAINEAIGVGAPRYNAGDVRGCCTRYWVTTQAILLAPAVRGFPGYARALAPLRPLFEAEPPTNAFEAKAIDDFAWALRHGFDAALRVLG